MKTLMISVTALLLPGAAPALAMSCGGGGKDKAAMCAKSGMAMKTKGKTGCCCAGMSSNMSKRG